MPTKFLNSCRLLLAYKCRPRVTAVCTVNGIQRSGTNYLSACLKELRVTPLNGIVPHERTDPTHKHFRWYDEKSAIPVFLRDQFGNDQKAADVDTLNALAGYPKRCKHIVMRKQKNHWLASACNWGLRVGWFGTQEQALNALEYLSRDYDSYYDFWQGLAKREPDRVLIQDLEVMQRDFPGFLANLDRLGIHHRARHGFAGQVTHVSMSPADRQKWVTIDDILAQLDT